MREDQKMHVCKLCDKRYPCGKSLGGHMRSHMIGNSSRSEKKAKLHAKLVSSSNGGRKGKKRESGFEAGELSGYGLRENPKKTWRAGDSGPGLWQEKVCKECGKEFQSLKALFGHMSSHSGARRVSNKFKDHVWTGGKQESLMDGQSDTEADASRPRKRMKKGKHSILGVSSTSPCLANESSSVSDIELEQEEVALCLMMLSRDSGHWDGVNVVGESSDNISVVLEDKSSSNDVRIAMKESLNCFCGDGMNIKDAELALFENSDSGCLWNGAKKVDSEVSVDEFWRNEESKNPELGDGFVYEESDAKLGKDLSKFQGMENEMKKHWIDDERCDQADRVLMKNFSRMKSTNDSYKGNSSKHGSSNVEARKNVQKKSKYVCFNCKKTFNSPQALGGHRAGHKKMNCCFASRYDSGKNARKTRKFTDLILDSELIDHDSSGCAEKQFKSKEGKRSLECPTDLEVFSSAKALDDQNRFHLVEGEEHESNQMDIKQELPEFPQLLDLNLPAPIE